MLLGRHFGSRLDTIFFRALGMSSWPPRRSDSKSFCTRATTTEAVCCNVPCFQVMANVTAAAFPRLRRIAVPPVAFCLAEPTLSCHAMARAHKSTESLHYYAEVRCRPHPMPRLLWFLPTYDRPSLVGIQTRTVPYGMRFYYRPTLSCDAIRHAQKSTENLHYYAEVRGRVLSTPNSSLVIIQTRTLTYAP